MGWRRTLLHGVGLLGVAAGLTAGAVGTAAPVRAAVTIVVDQEADEAPDPGNQCTAAPGDCSLRQAVDAAVDGDTITIEHLVDPQLTLGQIVLAEDLTIAGEGGSTDNEPLAFNPGTRLDAAHTSRIFDIASGADVVITDLLLQRGEAPTGEDGGAVRNVGTLRLQRVTVTNSRTTGAGAGGGIWSSGSLTLTDVVFAGVIALANTGPNSAGGDGGAIASTGSLSIDRATFDQNVAAGNGGGAIAVSSGTAEIANATFYRNRVLAGVGGAVYVGGGGQVSLVSSAVARNEAASGGGVGADGGAALDVEATWFQDNLPDTCSGPVTAGADALVWPADAACPATMTVAKAWTATATPGAPSGLDATFAPIIRIVDGSPAIDAIPAPGGVCSLGAHADQREIARPFGVGCDIGAFEAIENLFIAFDPNNTAITRTFLDGEERDVPLHAGNTGTRTASGVQVQLTFPAGVTVHSVTPPAGTTYDAGTGVWTVGDVLPGAQIDSPLMLRLSRNAPGDHVVTAEISSDQPGTAETGTLTVHEPAVRYAVVGGPASGDCVTLATGCAIEYAVELAAQEAETIVVAPGEHVLAAGAGLSVTNKSIVALDPSDRPTISAEVAGNLIGTSGSVRLADLDLVNPTRDGISIGSSTTSAVLERLTIRAGRRVAFMSSGSGLTIRDSVLEALGTFSNSQPSQHALVLSSSPATVENVTVIGRVQGAVLASGAQTLTNVIARDLGGGVDITATAGATIDVVSSNYATTGGAGTVTPPGTSGNQTDAPVFVDAAGHDFHQAAGSPTIDAGAGTPDAERRDIDFGPRAFGPSIDIGGDEFGPAVRLTPTSHDYGTLPVDGSFSHTFTVTNIGTASMSVSSLALNGADVDEFAITLEDCDLAIAPQDTCAVAVRFAPTTAGTKAVSLDVVTTGGTDSAALTGTGEAPPDTTGPVIVPSVVPSAPASGWHTSDVSVSWSVVDEESLVTGKDGCDDAPITTDGVVTLTCSATSAGGTSSEDVTIKRDTTAPTVTPTVPTTSAPSGWYLTAPTITFECNDANGEVETSGVASCPAAVTVDSSSVPQTVTGTATDVAGNTASTTVEDLKVDLIDPTVVCGATPTFAVGATGSVSATVTDAHSGPVAGIVSAPAITTATGSFIVPLTGTDNAGRTTTVPCPYLVERVATTLVASPIITRGLGGIITNVRPSAVLTRTDTGAPIAGEPVTLSLTRGPSCTAVTDANGRATCGTVIVLLNLFGGGTYKASYAGDATYQPSSATGTIP